MDYPTSNAREQAIREVADRFPNNYNALNWLRQNIESLGKSPSDLIVEDRYEEFYDRLEHFDD